MVDYFDWALSDKLKQTAYTTNETLDGEHGRIEVRRYYASSDIQWLGKKADWKGLESIVMVEAERTVAGETTSVERRYYISSLPAEAKQLNRAVQGHRSIENSLHWVQRHRLSRG